MELIRTLDEKQRLEQDLGTRPAEPVDTDSTDESAGDANSDFDDERSDENQAVPTRPKRHTRTKKPRRGGGSDGAACRSWGT